MKKTVIQNFIITIKSNSCMFKNRQNCLVSIETEN